ncbi:MAG TPA: hypothetical protein VGI71_05070 [Scandinavium sp.]
MDAEKRLTGVMPDGTPFARPTYEVGPVSEAPPGDKEKQKAASFGLSGARPDVLQGNLPFPGVA